MDRPLLSLHWENRYQCSSIFPSCSRNCPAAWSVGCQKVNRIPQNGKHGSVTNDGINFIHSISGKSTQTFFSPSYQGQFYFPYTVVSSSQIYVSCQQDSAHTGHPLIYWLVLSLKTFYFLFILSLLSFILPVFWEYYGDLLLTHTHRDEI